MVTKTVAITNLSPLVVYKANSSMEETDSNLYFSHPSVHYHHAEFFVQTKKLYIKDLSKAGLSQINGCTIGRMAMEWCPQAIRDGDILTLGKLEMGIGKTKVHRRS